MCTRRASVWLVVMDGRWTRVAWRRGRDAEEPGWFEDWIRDGFVVRTGKGKNKAELEITLYRAFAQWFYEQLKHRDEVFRIFTASELNGTRDEIRELKAMFGVRPSSSNRLTK